MSNLAIDHVSTCCNSMRVELLNPRGHFRLDEQTGECKLYWDNGWILILYCPHCGAPAPKRNPVPQYSPIPNAERERLEPLLNQLGTLDDAIVTLGAPDQTTSTQSFFPEQYDDPPRVFKAQGVYVYTSLSDAVDVWLTERIDGKATWQLRGKALENQPARQSQNEALHAERRWWRFWTK